MPSNSWGEPNFLFEPIVSKVHVIDDILIMSASFIVHAPTSIHKFKASLLNEHANFVFHVIGLILPPHTEEFHFDICELLGGI